ncbi:MAG: DNA repair exonuclease [Planctomycetota bacterium]
MTTRLLCVGDLHLGRRPSRVPTGADPDEHGPAAAWRRCVEFALRRRVHAVLMAGDVVERIEDRFAAFDALRRGVERLAEAGIQVIGVTGNHDVQALPRLADLIPSFVLLGRGGRWEEVALDAPDPVRVVGWSFPERHHDESPLGELPRRAQGSALRVGLLHADLDVSGSRYAPITSGELEAADADAWLLGHVHAPSALSAAKPRGYLGSVVALDPSETGPHGPWVLEVDGGKLRFEQVPLAPLRFEHRDVELADGDLLGALTRTMRELEAELSGAEDAATSVGLRVRLVGEVAAPQELARALDELRSAPFEHTGAGTTIFLDKISDATAPAVDLAARSERDDYPGLVAHRMLALEGGGDGRDEVLGRARKSLQREWTRIADRLGLKDLEVDDALLEQCLRRAGSDLVAALVAQVENRPATAVAPGPADESDDDDGEVEE